MNPSYYLMFLRERLRERLTEALMETAKQEVAAVVAAALADTTAAIETARDESINRTFVDLLVTTRHEKT